jgi:hypothetical protein
MTIQRHRRLLSGEKTGVQKDRSNATLTPEMIASQWKPGESGNPSGRPKTKPISDALRELLAEEYAGNEERFKGLSNAHVLAVKLFEMADAGDLKALQEITNRLEGMAPQSLTMGGPNGGAIPWLSLSRDENERRLTELLAKAGLEN